MNIVVSKKKKIVTSIKAPTSKSYAIRVLICAFLSKQKLTITNVDLCDDIIATLNCLKKLGANCHYFDHKVLFDRPSKMKFLSRTLNVLASATLLRLLIPILLVLYPDIKFKIKCDDTLINRPMDGYNFLFEENKVSFIKKDNFYILKGQIYERNINVDALKSSQYISGLLLALPLRNCDTSLNIMNFGGSSDYVQITLNIMRLFGIDIFNYSDIKGRQVYHCKQNILKCEGDFSSAAFLIATSIFNQELTIEGLNENSMQGDKRIIEIIKKAKGNIEFVGSNLKVYPRILDSFNVDCDKNIDLAPILFALAVKCKNPSHFKNITRLKYKESNRLNEALEIFDCMQITYALNEDELVIYPSKEFKFNEVFNSKNDHRIVQMLLVLVSLSTQKLEISNAEAVNKSYQNLFHDLKLMGFFINKISSPKILINVEKESDLKLKAFGYVLGYEKFTLFAPRYFSYNFIKNISRKKKIFLILNALLHQSKMLEFENEIKKLSSLNINYIVQDIGAIEIIKKYVPVNKIIFMPYTLICNKFDAISYMNEKYLSLGISNEITIKDTYEISKITKIFVTIFGYVPMYQSYRKIVSLYQDYKDIHFDLDNLSLREDTRNEKYHISENEWGSVIFRPDILNYLDCIDYLMHVKYVFLDKHFIKENIFERVLLLTNEYFKNNLSIIKLKNEIAKLNIPNSEGFKYEDSLVRRDT